NYPIPEGYEVVDRKPRVGDKILVTSAFMSGGEYTNGDILTVEKVTPNNIEVKEADIGLLFGEFEVIERKLEEVFEVGDIVRVTRFQNGAEEGELVEVISASETAIMYKTVDHSYFASLDAVELVAKASARVDKNVEV